MLKKTVGSFIAVSALGFSLFSINSFASQLDNSSITPTQTSSPAGWAKLYQNSKGTVDSSQGQVTGAKSSAQGQSSFVKGSQVQSGVANGDATASQKEDVIIDVAQDGQSTNGSGSVEQTAQTSGGYVVQGQHTTQATFQFQGSIQGGPSLQHQVTQGHTYQFSTSISK